MTNDERFWEEFMLLVDEFNVKRDIINKKYIDGKDELKTLTDWYHTELERIQLKYNIKN